MMSLLGGKVINIDFKILNTLDPLACVGDEVSEWRNRQVSHLTPLRLNGSQQRTNEFGRYDDEKFKKRDFSQK